MRALKKILILSHRYMGIPLSSLFVVWFFSAFVMIYAGGMPRVTPDIRIEGASSLDFNAISVSPLEAVGILGYSPPEARLRTLLGRPVYEFPELRYPSAFIWADSGEFLSELSVEEGAQIASDFLDIPVGEIHFSEFISEPDQWTIAQVRDLPLFKYEVSDEFATEVYVSPLNANVSVYTTRQSRLLAWLGTIPHWFYFADLRANQPLWYNLVVWTSGLGCILVLMGLTLSVTQFRKIRPFDLKRAIPYHGFRRWHYILGSVFGIFALTWAFSGMLSMEPFAWTNARGLAVDENVYAEGNLDFAAFPPLEEQPWDTLDMGDIKEVDFRWIAGQPYYSVNYSTSGSDTRVAMDKRDRLHQPYYIIGQLESGSQLISAHDFQVQDQFNTETLVQKLDNNVADASVIQWDLLDNYDDYYYSRGQQLPLPVLRVKFDDPALSWIYIDPRKAELLSLIPRNSRIERWLYSGLHSLDFRFWYHSRPLWDIGVLLLLTGGLLISLLGLYLALKRVKYDVQALLAKFRKQQGSEVTGVSN